MKPLAFIGTLIMNLYAKLILSLGAISGIAAGLLSYTFVTTAPIIADREIEDRQKALQNVFFLQNDGQGGAKRFALDAKPLADGVVALYAKDNSNQPAYFAVTGQAVGYNSSVPITLMVGFTGPAKDAATLLKGYVEQERLPGEGEKGEYIVGFSVVNSEETPGLGEKIKDSRPPYTWSQVLTGNRPQPNPDSSTDFQRQFRGRQAGSLMLKKNGGDLDAITASTITSNGVLSALRNASEKLDEALSKAR